MSASAISWSEARDDILRNLDFVAEYRAMGVDVVGGRPNEKGWVTCRAVGREDNNPSARINVRTGYYRDYGGTGEALSFFDFAALHGGYPDWKAARRHFAKQTGVKLPGGGEAKRPIDSLEFYPTRQFIFSNWCRGKDPNNAILGQAVAETGARLAAWPKDAPKPEWQQRVIAFPGYGPHLLDADPVGWFLVNSEGGDIRQWLGKGKGYARHKVHTVGGSQPCLLNKFALERIEKAQVIWKVEGLADMLVMQSWIPPEYRDVHVVITNGFGAQETPQKWMLDLLRGKTVHVVGDADHPGEVGADKWVAHLADVARVVKKVALPFEIKPVHGEDIRDLRAKHGPDMTDDRVEPPQAQPEVQPDVTVETQPAGVV